MGILVCMLLVIGGLAHLLWVGIHDLFLRASPERRQEALTYAFLFSIMGFCCLGLTWAVVTVYVHVAHTAF